MSLAYEEWIGRTRTEVDCVTQRLVAEYKLTLGTLCGPGEVPAGFHWALSPDMAAAGDLGRDGHPRPGHLLPKLPLPRRMWAGGEVKSITPFRQGETITRSSKISDVTFKTGRSGDLGFVTLHHHYHAGTELRLTDRQDIVYRQDPAPDAPAPPLNPGPDWLPRQAWRVTPDSTLLFRYSALTFNGHRIHYDYPYATGVEGYAGLVVHGPLQSTWMQNLAATIFGAAAASFSYRGLTPLIAGTAAVVEARDSDAGLELRVRRESDGVVTMQGSAVRA